MVNLRALEAAIQKVETISQEELEFQAGDTRVTLRPLRPMEETAVQRWARVAWEGANEEGDNAAFAEYLDRLRFGILGYAIVELDGLDLRNVEYLETGEEDEKGRPIEVPKHEALRDMMVREWSRMMLTEVYAKYSALTDRVEFRASEAVEYDPADLDDEIARLEKRLKTLKEKKEKDAKGPEPDRVRQETRAAGEINKAQRKSIRQRQDLSEEETSSDSEPETIPAEEAPHEPEVPVEPRTQVPEPTQGRRSAIPDAAAAPPREQFSEEPSEEPQYPPEPRNLEEAAGGDSFFDPSDPDSEDAVRAESQRQAELYRQHLERKRQNEEIARQRREQGLPNGPARRPQPQGVRPQASARMDDRTGGLRSAANASDAVFNAGAGAVTTARPARATPAQLGGAPVYKMPTQTLEKPQRPRDPAGRVIGQAPARDAGPEINPEGGSRNPRFRGPEDQ